MDERLTNFYNEYKGTENFAFLFRVYSDIFEGLYDMADEKIRNKLFREMGTYSYIPVFSSPTGNAGYNLNELVDTPTFVKWFNVSELAIEDRMDMWTNTVHAKDKAEYLKSIGSYMEFNTDRVGIEEEGKIEHPVVDFTMYDTKSRRLIENADYFFLDNKVYFLKDISDISVDREVIFKDIAIDYNLPEELLGHKILVPYSNTITKDEYREMLYALLQVAMGGLTISNLNNALNYLSGSGGGFKVVDIKSANRIQRDLWEKNGVITASDLTRFDFIIYTPLDYMAEQEKMKIIEDFLNSIKMSDTSFMFSPIASFHDLFRLDWLKHIITKHLDVTGWHDKVGEWNDEIDIKSVIRLFDKFSAKDFFNWSTSHKLSDKYVFKKDTIEKYVNFNVLNEGSKFDKMKTSDDVSNVAKLDIKDITPVVLPGQIRYDEGYGMDAGYKFDVSGEDWSDKAHLTDKINIRLIR